MRDRRALVIVCVVPVICWLACWPFVDMGVNDDWGYAWTVKRLMETGGFRYNGWIAPILWPQALWGAAWASAFGFSHDVLRLSTLPLSVACAALAFRLHRALHVPTHWAMFATLLLVTSPLFTPWSASFMTDVPSLALTLLLFLAIVWLARAERTSDVAIRAAALAAIAFVGGTNRQTLFVFGGVALMLAIWRRREEPRAAAAIAAILGTLVVGTAAVIAWYKRQLFAVVELSPPIDHPITSIVSMTGLTLTLALWLAPIGVAWLRWCSVRWPTRVAIAAAWLVLCLGVRVLAPRAYVGNFLMAPWAGNTVTETGLMFDGIEAPGDQPILFNLYARAAMAAGVFWLLTLMAIEAWRHRQAIVEVARQMILQRGRPATLAVAAMFAICLAYAALLFPRAGLLVVFDRYLLVAMPVATGALLMFYRRRARLDRPGAAAWALLAVYALLGVGITFDSFVQKRARLRIANELRAAGVPRTAIVNGFPYDAWTQLSAWGYINEKTFTNPPGVYRYDPRTDEMMRLFWFLPRTPAIQPRWLIANVTTLPPADERRGLRVYESFRLLPPRKTYLVAFPVRLSDLPKPEVAPDGAAR